MLLGGNVLFASTRDGRDGRYASMGIRGLALSDSYGTMFANPATLVYNPGNLLSAIWMGDSGYVHEPFSGLLLSFHGKHMGFTVEQATEFEKREDALYNAMKYTYLEMDWAYNWKWLAFGLRLHAQTAMKRSSIVLSSGREFSDFWVQTFFSRYENKPNSTKVVSALGALADFSWFQFGVVSDQFAEASDEGNISFSGSDLVENLCFGVSFATPSFNRLSRLNLLKGIASVEFVHPFQKQCAIQGGVDLKLQLLPDFQIDVMAGWEQPYERGELFSLDGKEGTQTAGVVVSLQNWEIAANARFSGSVYWGEWEKEELEGTFSLTYKR